MLVQKAYRVRYSRKDTEGWEREHVVIASSFKTAKGEAKAILGKDVIIKSITLIKSKKRETWQDIFYETWFGSTRKKRRQK